MHHEVLLEQRPASLTVMPGLWELPMLREAAVPKKELLLTVHHAIMQVNYCVRIRMVSWKAILIRLLLRAARGAGFRWARRREWR